MALLNHAKKELNAKIVYYGPGLSGKTTNLEWIHKKMEPEKRGKLISLETKTDRTLFFDFLPVQIGEIGGYRMRFNVYTVPGQIFYNETRKMVLKGVDGVVFVADCQKEMATENVESMKNLAENLASIQKDVAQIPLVLQYNKMDLPNTLTVEEMNRLVNAAGHPFFEAIAVQGEGVLTTLARITRMVAEHLRTNLFREKDEAPSPPPSRERPPAGRTHLPGTTTRDLGTAPAFLEPDPPAAAVDLAGDLRDVPGNEPGGTTVPAIDPKRAGRIAEYGPFQGAPLLNDAGGQEVGEKGMPRVTPLRRDPSTTPARSSHPQGSADPEPLQHGARQAPALPAARHGRHESSVVGIPPPGRGRPGRADREPQTWADPSVVRFPEPSSGTSPADLQEEPFTVHLEGAVTQQGGDLQVPIRIRRNATGDAFLFCLRIRIEPCGPTG